MGHAMSCVIPSNPDVSGIGVRIAIYIQNLLCFILAIWALWDGKVTDYEMDSAEAHSTTNLVLAFAILISCIFQALARELTNYHGSIILSLSWMNNTNAFIYFLLYAQYRSQGDNGIKHFKDWVEHVKTQFKTIMICLDGGRLREWLPLKLGGTKKRRPRNEWFAQGASKVLFKQITLLLGSLHLTLMAALGIWLWSAPKSFGSPESADCVTEVADLAIFGAHVQFGSPAFRITSLAMYSIILVPGLNLILPMTLFLSFHCWYHARQARQQPTEPLLPQHNIRNPQALESSNVQDPQPAETLITGAPAGQSTQPLTEEGLGARFQKVLPVCVGLLFLLAVNVIFIADIELTLHRNTHLQTEVESRWGFGQILALLLVSMPLKDLVEAIFRKRQEMQNKLNEALKKAVSGKNLKEIYRWVGAGADVDVPGDEGLTALDIASSQKDQSPLVSLLIEKGADTDRLLTLAIGAQNCEYILLCVNAGADINLRTVDGQTALEIACAHEGQGRLVSLLIEKEADLDTLLALAIGAKNCEYIALCVNAGADISLQAVGERPNSSRHCIFWRGQQELISALVKRGVHVQKALAEAVSNETATVAPISRCLVVALRLTPPGHPYHLKTLCDVANALSNTGSVGDLHEAIPLYREVLEHRPQGDPELATTLYDLATALSKSGSVSYLHEAIPLYRQALELRYQGNPERNATLDGLANALYKRDSVGDLQESIGLYREVLDLVPPGRPDRLNALDNLTNALFKAGSIGNLGEMTNLYREILEFCLPGDPQHDSALTRLGSLPSKMRPRVAEDLHESVRVLRAALDLVPPGLSWRPPGKDPPLSRGTRIRPLGHPERHHTLNNLADSLSKTGSRDDLPESIQLFREALELQPSGHPLRDTTLSNLANVLEERGSPGDLQESIHHYRAALKLRPSDHPEHSTTLDGLANALSKAASVSDPKESIPLHREALILRPAGHPKRHQTLYDLASALSKMEIASYLPEYTSLYREAIELRPPGHPEHERTVDGLVNALSKAASISDLEGSISLHREALDLRPPGHLERYATLDALANALFKRDSVGDLQESITLYREVLGLVPPGHPDRLNALDNLANALFKAGCIGDLREMTKLYREVLELCPHGHPQRDSPLANLANSLYKIRDASNLHESIPLLHEVLDLIPLDYSTRDTLLHDLAISLNNMGSVEALRKSIDLFRKALDLRPPGHPQRGDTLAWLEHVLSEIRSPSDLQERIRLNREALELRPSGHPQRGVILNNLALALSNTGSLDDLQESIRLHREALELWPPGHPDRHFALSGLAYALRETGYPDVLQESIQLDLEALELQPPGHSRRDTTLNNLALALSDTGSLDDLEESIRYYQEVLDLQPPGHRYRATTLNNLAYALEKRGSSGDLEEVKHLWEEAQAIRSLR